MNAKPIARWRGLGFVYRRFPARFVFWRIHTLEVHPSTAFCFADVYGGSFPDIVLSPSQLLGSSADNLFPQTILMQDKMRMLPPAMHLTNILVLYDL